MRAREENVADPSRPSNLEPPPRPRWVKTAAIIVLALVVLVVAMLLFGGGPPGLSHGH
jgi:hypothetical protein